MTTTGNPYVVKRAGRPSYSDRIQQCVDRIFDDPYDVNRDEVSGVDTIREDHEFLGQKPSRSPMVLVFSIGGEQVAVEATESAMNDVLQKERSEEEDGPDAWRRDRKRQTRQEMVDEFWMLTAMAEGIIPAKDGHGFKKNGGAPASGLPRFADRDLRREVAEIFREECKRR